LIFGDDNHGTGSNTTMRNDLTDLRITMAFGAATDTYTLNGNALTIEPPPLLYSRSIDVYSGGSSQVTFNCPINFEFGASVYVGAEIGDFTENTAEIHFNGDITIEGELDLVAQGWSDLAGANGVIDLEQISGTGEISATTLGDNDDTVIVFGGNTDNTFSGTLFLTTQGNSQIKFAKVSGVVVNATARVGARKGDTARLSLDQPDQISSDANITVSQGSQLQLIGGYSATINTLFLSNVSADASPSVVNTGSHFLNLQNIESSVDNDHVHPTIQGAVKFGLGSNVQVDGGPEPGLEISGTARGPGFDKYGSGTLRLSYINFFDAHLTLTEGTVEVVDGRALQFTEASDAGVRLEGGTLLLQGVTVSNVYLAANPTCCGTPTLMANKGCRWDGPVLLNAPLSVFALDPTDSGLVMDFSGPISGSGELDLLSPVFGAGTVRLSGSAANTFIGPLRMDCSRLELAKAANVAAVSGRLIVGSGNGDAVREVRWLSSYQCLGTALTLFPNGLVNLNGFNDHFGGVTFNGGRVETGTGEMDLDQGLTVNPVPVTAVINGYLGLPQGIDAFFNIDRGTADPDLQVNALVFGKAPQLVKQGPGTLRFSGPNTYIGSTLVNEGVLHIDNPASLGSLNVGSFVRSNATLRVSGFFTIAEPLSINGPGAFGSDGTLQGALQVITGARVVLTGGVLVVGGAVINVGVEASLAINAAIGGTGSLNKIGAGTLTLGGNQPNSFSGDTLVTHGTLALNKPTRVAAVPGNLIIGGNFPDTPAAVQNFSSFNILGSITVDRSGLWDLNGQAEGISHPPLTLNHGGSVRTGSGIFYLPAGGDIVVNPGSLGVSIISGNIGLDPGTHHFTVKSRLFHLAAPECTVNAVVSQTASAANLVKDGDGSLLLSGTNTYTGNTIVSAGALQVEGTQPQSPVQVNGGRLQGSGIVGPNAITSGSGIVAPGSGVGILTCGSVNATGSGAGTLEVNLNGPHPGIDYSQLNVVGTVNLTGLSLNASLNFAPADTNQFVIINNDGTDPVLGTFNGLPQNAQLLIGGAQFTVRYNGGDGNDVVLTPVSALAAPASIWTNTLGGDWNNPLNWNNHVVPSASNATITNNGNYTITNNANVSLAQFYFGNSVCTLSGLGSLNLSGLFTWEAGSFDGPGTVAAQGGMHIGGPASSTIKSIAGKMLLNTATATWSEDGMIYLSGGATLSNAVSGTFDCAGNGTLQNLLSSNLVINAGRFRKTGGSGTTFINVPFINNGTVEIQSGTLSLNFGGTNTGTITVPAGGTFNLGGGTHMFTSGSTISGAGNFTTAFGATATLAGQVNITGPHTFNGGNINFAGDYNCFDDLTISGANVSFNGSGTIAPASLTLSLFGNLGGSNLVTVSGHMTWGNDSTLSGSNSIIANGGLTIPPGSVFLDGRTLVNMTTGIWSNNAVGSIELADGAVLSNAPSATFDCIGDGIIQNSAGSNLAVNSGVFRKIGEPSTTTIYTPFNNSGTIELQSGVLNLGGGGTTTGEVLVGVGAGFALGGGTHNFSPASSITGAGDFTVSGGTANLAGLISASGTHTFSFGTANITGNYSCIGNVLNITGGTANFNGTGLIVPSALTISGFGILGGTNPVTVTGPINLRSSSSIVGGNNIIAKGGLNISGGAFLSGRTLVNLGTATWSNNVASSLTLSDGAVLTNAPGAIFDCASDSFIFKGPGSNVFINAGLFRKSGGNNTTTIQVPFSNFGEVESQTGRLSFDGPFSVEQGGLVRLRGGEVTNTLPMQLHGGFLQGNGLISGAVVNHGLVSPGASPGQIVMASDYTQAADGMLNIELAGTEPGIGFDRLIVSNAATLGGTLNVTLTNGFYPTPNSSFTFLKSANCNGTFAAFNYPTDDIGLALNYTSSNVTLQVINTRPIIAPIPDQTITNHSPFRLAIQATDNDLPAQTLAYTLSPTPFGASIDTNGVIDWTPNLLGAPITISLTVLVTDNGTPNLMSSRTFRITVIDRGASTVTSLQPGVPGVHSNTLIFVGFANSTYVTQFATNLPGPWFSFSTNLADTNGFWQVIDPSATNPARFYRVLWPGGP
jgi:autotransporter-associated beta strand protein